MQPMTDAAAHGERPTTVVVSTSKLVRALCWCAIAILLAVAIVMVVVAPTRDHLVTLIVSLVSLLVLGVPTLWGGYGQSITISRPRGEDKVSIKAPFYRLEFLATDVSAVETAADNGLNSGLLNWPVTGDAKSPGGIRINVGGTRRIEFDVAGKGHYEVVLKDADQEQEARRLLTEPDASHQPG